MGVSSAQLSYSKGVRSTSEQAFLDDRPSNLTVWINTRVSKIIFEDKKAVGLETVDGKKGGSSFSPMKLVHLLSFASSIGIQGACSRMWSNRHFQTSSSLRPRS